MFVNVDVESTWNTKMSPAVTLVVQPVNVVSEYFTPDDMVGFADAVIVSATVGG